MADDTTTEPDGPVTVAIRDRVTISPKATRVFEVLEIAAWDDMVLVVPVDPLTVDDGPRWVGLTYVRPATYTRAAVSAALNRACGDIGEHVADLATRAALNLLVNACLTYLDRPAASILDAIDEHYESPPDTVLAWLA